MAAPAVLLFPATGNWRGKKSIEKWKLKSPLKVFTVATAEISRFAQTGRSVALSAGVAVVGVLIATGRLGNLSAPIAGRI